MLKAKEEKVLILTYLNISEVQTFYFLSYLLFSLQK